MISFSDSSKSATLTRVELTNRWTLGQNSISETSLVFQAKRYRHLRFKPTGESSKSLENITALFHRAYVNLDISDFRGI